MSFYDTEPLRATLNELVDFDRINNGDVRISLGAVNVRTGESRYFDSARDVDRRVPCHGQRRASPWVPAGRRSTASSIGTAASCRTRRCNMCARISASARSSWRSTCSAAKGELPQNLNQVQERAKDIQYQSKQRLTDTLIRKIETLRSTLADVLAKLPESLRSDPQVQKLAEVSQRGPLSLVHLVNRHDTGSSDFKDYEFSRATIDDLWRGGQYDVAESADAPRSLPRHRLRKRRARLRTLASRRRKEALHGRDRSPEARVRDAADQSGVSARTVPLHRSRVLHRHLPDRPRGAQGGDSGAAGNDRSDRQIRIHPHARTRPASATTPKAAR